MISIEKLREYANLKSFNLGQAEIDYYQEVILFILSREFGRELLFKGGTALTKCFGFDRFSEDLDFNLNLDTDVEKIISSGLKKFYIEFEVVKNIYKNSKNLIYRLKGPLYNGNKNSFCKVSLDFSLREKNIVDGIISRIGLHIDEIPSFDIIVMSKEEIFAEKIRAIYTRNKARDLYDLYFLIKGKVKADKNLINTKLKLYSLKFQMKTFKQMINNKETIWDSEMENLTKTYPDFKELKKDIFNVKIK
ncbi:MAG: nucleotidyl transferase AbiEii/AbiGii toxin family protein [Nanoarchaeota archaeon]